MCDHKLEKIVDFKMTKHFYESERWQNYARMFCHDYTKIEKKKRIKIKKFDASLYLYKIFEIFLIL